ncbi:hypothetical protein KAI32_02100 [Candidatus Pacearchaeota archaeon]|nr:hypothetical protein [Candidatus Pacearchaeota archaeon]
MVKLRSTDKGKFRCEFNFEKSDEVIDAITSIVGRLGMNESPENNLRDLIYDERSSGLGFKIEEAVDEIYGMNNKDYFVNIFLGNEKIILVVNSFTDKQKEISEAVFEFADFEEVRK